MQLIFDKNIEGYSPRVNLSEIDLFEVNLKKYKKLFIYVDSWTAFFKTYNLFSDNCVFLYDDNIVIDLDNNIFIDNKIDRLDNAKDFVDSILHFDFIKEYLKKK